MTKKFPAFALWQLHYVSLIAEKCPKVESHTWQIGSRDNGTLGQVLGGQLVCQLSTRQYAPNQCPLYCPHSAQSEAVYSVKFINRETDRVSNSQSTTITTHWCKGIVKSPKRRLMILNASYCNKILILLQIQGHLFILTFRNE